MFPERGPGMCSVHGPAHMGFPCPDASAEASKVDISSNPLEEYGDLDTMFQMERLDENFDSVQDQIDSLRTKIERLKRLNAEHKEDLDMGVYVDEAQQEVDDAFANFSINGKKFDIRSLCEGRQIDEDKNVDNFNTIVSAVNGYAEMYMIGQNAEYIDSF